MHACVHFLQSSLMFGRTNFCVISLTVAFISGVHSLYRFLKICFRNGCVTNGRGIAVETSHFSCLVVVPGTIISFSCRLVVCDNNFFISGSRPSVIQRVL